MACPALAIEIGKSSIPDASQNNSFEDADYQAHIAQAIAAGILEWKANGWRTSDSPAEAARP
jgi:N-acetylmuramoyl-L-alanine amidase